MARVLIVDDTETLRRVMARSIKRTFADQVEVFVAEDADAVLRNFEKDNGEYDFHILVTDQEMPGMNGTALVKRLRDRGYAGPAILYSGVRPDQHLRAEIDRLSITHALKPDMNLVLNQLRTILAPLPA